jgi:hypothetical protein
VKSPSTNALKPALVLAVSAWACLGCAATPKDADYVGNPSDMNDSCTRAATVCPTGDDWIACKDDQWECHRLGLWFEDGIKVVRDPERARRIFETMCDRFEMASCKKLCDSGDAKRCVDLALLGIAGAGGRPFPPGYDARDRATFDKACRSGDDVACLMLELDYVRGSQRVVQRVGNCRDDSARCFAAACDEADPLGCALLCHVGDSRACSKLAELGSSGVGFEKNRPLAPIASRLLGANADDAASRSDSEPGYEFERTEQPAGTIPRAPPPPEQHVGAGLWSGWRTVGNIEGASFGLTPVLTRTVGRNQHTTDVSGLVGFFSEIFMQSWYPAHDKYLRFSLAGALGGGTAGLDGRLSHDAMAGFRFPFSTTRSNPYSGGALYQSMSAQDRDALDSAVFTRSPHALFLRGGYSLRYSAVGPLLSSAIELPRVEAGYQFEGEGSVVRALELRANAALVLIGRFDVEEDEQPLGGALAWGGSIVLHSRRVHAQVGAQRIQAAAWGDRPAVHRVDTSSCLRVVARDERHYKYLVCLQELLERGSPGGSDVTAWQAGVFFGVDGLD